MGHSAILSVRITGNANDAVKAFEKATKKAAAFGSFMGNIAAKGVGKLWDKLTGFGADVVNMSDSVDKFKNTMKFAGLDTSAVDKAAQAARKYADETVYGLDDVQNTMAQLAANGIGNYTELTQAAGNLNAVAGGNKDTFKSVAMMLTQTAGAGKLTTENWNQLADAIPGASGKLQEAMKKNGAYTGNFRDAMAKGEITAEEFNKALADLGMTDVAREAATSTQTIEGAMGNLEAAVTGGLTDAFNLFKPAVTGAMSTAADAISTFSKTATDNLGKFMTAFTDSGTLETGRVMLEDIGNAGRALGDAFGALIDAINPFSGQIKDATDAGSLAGEMFNTLTEYVGAASLKVQDTAAWLKDLAAGLKDSGAAQTAIGVFNSVRDVFNSVVDAIKAIIGELPGIGSGADVGRRLGDAFNGAAGVVNKVLDVLKGIADWAANHSGAIISAVAGIAGAFGAFKAAEAAKKAFDAFKTGKAALDTFKKAQEASTIAQAAFNAVMNANPIMLVVTAIGLVVAALTYFFTQTETGRKAWASFMDWLGAAWNGLVATLQPVIDAIGALWNSACEFAGALWEAFSTRLAEIWAAIQPILQPVIDWIMTQWQICGDAIKLVWDTVCSAIETIVNVIKGIFDVATAVIRGDWEGAGNAVRNIWNAIGGFFSGLGSRIAGFFSSACSRIAGFFSGAGNSVKAAWNGVVNWFAGLPGRIMGIFAGAGSWLAGAGQAIMDGLLGGLKSAWNNVTSFVGGIGDWIKSHKGPPAYDRIMLVENGKLIMSGFAKGLTSGFDSDVRKAITSVNGRLKTMPLNVTAAYERGAKDTATPITVNVKFNGVVGDPEGVARQINKLLDDYTAKRR